MRSGGSEQRGRRSRGRGKCRVKRLLGSAEAGCQHGEREEALQWREHGEREKIARTSSPSRITFEQSETAQVSSRLQGAEVQRTAAKEFKGDLTIDGTTARRCLAPRRYAPAGGGARGGWVGGWR
jgi:hypothetical protein